MQGTEALIRAGVSDATFQELAKASSVPVRTIYRYYPTKEALVTAFWEWFNHERLRLPPPPRSIPELLAQLPLLFATFEQHDALVRTMLHDRAGRAIRSQLASDRRDRFRSALADTLAELDPEGQRRLLASVQLLFSAAAWESMKDNWKLEATEAADAAAWAISALITHAQRHKTTRPAREKRS